ncbi:hypothetical protein KAFR_0C00460 [Kazachstania africana CBS 2517]|uniref:RING-type domain-containing protein n=1 Tax=Kazachstania africana (strain ATCC 22294 / BCRC 22015 / CBS 2517 / CECT 1963 / NBRC 1671 / NRRL Y-8276) TaxID=1071382 RepID=H2ARP1_KAZAF|nr:hypothetical protein KAFR_0C00460 [Kazachstania africana CBS 2517]CCF57041.1 hypothetical protein KAFR_0C00460 [Kazachstania africana CBS 2517]
MSSYHEEHNTSPHTQSNPQGRREIRSEFRNLYEQLTPTDPTLISLLASLLPPELQEEWGKKSNEGCSQAFIDSLPRVPKDKIPNDLCSICFENFREDEYPLVIELPHCSHKFDLQCISVWLSSNSTCPVCRDKVNHNAKLDIDTTEAELEEDWGMYG